jgi:hypothetical protein|tara:strand:- start:278 stop:856 length:579 start_codon:yes stop_codon:yes gene_type:complete
MLSNNITPNQCLLLFGIKNKISLSGTLNQHLEIKGLLAEALVKVNHDGSVKITVKGEKIIRKYNNYFVKAKKRTNSQLMGKEFLKSIQKYRLMFPARKLPSGKPARVNVKTLERSFRWFFEEYDYSWSQIFKATSQYVNEYEDKEYLYMKTSQYFISKEDKNKVKHSELADYCDMIEEGIETDNQSFKEKVV